MTARTEKALIALAVQTVLAAGFVAIGQATARHAIPPPPWLDTPLDRSVPLVPGWVWVYATWYPAPLALLAAERIRFRRAAAAVLVAFAACACGYLAWPVRIDRPPADGRGASFAALAVLYRIDPPVNVFPSFHAALAAVLVAVGPARGPARTGIVAWMLAVCVSCVLTKQHYVLDVLAGAAVGFAADRLATRLLGTTPARRPRPRAAEAAAR